MNPTGEHTRYVLQVPRSHSLTVQEFYSRSTTIPIFNTTGLMWCRAHLCIGHKRKKLFNESMSLFWTSWPPFLRYRSDTGYCHSRSDEELRLHQGVFGIILQFLDHDTGLRMRRDSQSAAEATRQGRHLQPGWQLAELTWATSLHDHLAMRLLLLS